MAKKIEKLTAAQAEDMRSTYAYWLAVGRNTQPIDRARAESAISAMYLALGKERPLFLQFSSPMVAMLAIAVMRVVGNSERDQLWGQLGDQLRGQLRGQLWGQLGGQLLGQLRGQLGDQLGGQLLGQLWGQLGDQLGGQLLGQLRGQLGDQLRGQLGDQLGGQLLGQLRDQLGDQLGGQLGGQLGDQLWGQLGGQLGGQLRGQLWGQLGGQLNWSFFAGQHWCAWEVFYDFCNRIGVNYTPQQRSTLDLWLEQSRSCHWWWPMNGVCVLTERHSVLTVDDRGRLHNETGPACAYADGYQLHFWHGIAVTKQVIESPETITLEQINAEANAEVRRIMVERFGYERYLRASNARLIDSCPDNHALKGLRTAKLWSIGDIVMLDVLNSTPEPDGTTKRYVIPVDGSLYGGRAGRECLAATASTWRKRGDNTQLVFARPEDYAPAFES